MVDTDTDEHMLSTIDNPYNPFIQFAEWYAWDVNAGYHSLAYLARIIVTSDDLSEADESRVLEDAITEIVTENVHGVYIRVKATDTIPRQAIEAVSK